MKRLLNLITIGGISIAAAACNSSVPTAPSNPAAGTATELTAKPEYAAAAKPGNVTIVGLVTQDDGEFDVLQAAVMRAGLVDALNGSTQYTVFAPTDTAFVSTLAVANEAAALAVVNTMDQATLRNILLFHVANGRRNSNSVLAAPSYTMLNGDKLTRTQLSAAGFAATDISASNGIVHVINGVLLPPAK